jgi:hypothetical protein
MRHLLVTLFLVVYSSSALAGQPEAREVARLNNCPPKKIEVVQNFPGGLGKTVYRVACTLPKTTGSGGADALLIECEQSLCTLIRPVSTGSK